MKLIDAQIWSCGGGTQSGAMAVLIAQGRLPKPDLCYMTDTGWQEDIPHSACYMCPNLADSEWVDMKTNWPDDFWRAVLIERELRKGDPHFWLHPSCQPLDEVDFDAQQTMFADRGCTGGCFT